MRKGRTDTASVVVAASPSAVYQAMIDPAAVVVWLPPEGMTGEVDEFDPRPGGLSRITLIYDDSGAVGKTDANRDVTVSEFVELEPDSRIVQRGRFESDNPDFAGDMLFTWLLEPAAEGTRVTVIAENVPSGVDESDHLEGLNSTLSQLARFVES